MTMGSCRSHTAAEDSTKLVGLRLFVVYWSVIHSQVSFLAPCHIVEVFQVASPFQNCPVSSTRYFLTFLELYSFDYLL